VKCDFDLCSRLHKRRCTQKEEGKEGRKEEEKDKEDKEKTIKIGRL